MSETELGAAEKATPAETPREKASFAPVGLLAIILTPIVIVTSIFFSYNENRTFYAPVTSDLNVAVVISAPQFLQVSGGNVCDGKAPLVWLSTATVQIKASGWSENTILGEGILNAQGKCVYKSSVTPPADFAGGNVTARVIFTFGETEDFVINVGNSTPFKTLDLVVNLG